MCFAKVDLPHWRGPRMHTTGVSAMAAAKPASRWRLRYSDDWVVLGTWVNTGQNAHWVKDKL